MKKDSAAPIYVVIHQDKQVVLFTPAAGFEQDESWRTLPHCTLAGVKRSYDLNGAFTPIIKTTNVDSALNHLNIILQTETE